MKMVYFINLLNHYNLDPALFLFPKSTYTHVRSNTIEPKKDTLDVPGFIPVKHHGTILEADIKTYSCPDCISKQKEIDQLIETIKLKDEIIDAKEDALIAFRGKRENLPETGT